MKSNQGGCHHEKQNRLCKSRMERTALAGCVQSDGSSKGCFVGAVRICGGTGQHDDGNLAFWCCFMRCSSAKPPASDCIWCSSGKPSALQSFPAWWDPHLYHKICCSGGDYYGSAPGISAIEGRRRKAVSADAL